VGCLAIRNPPLQWASVKGAALIQMKQYLAEAIGTFALVFAGTGAIVINDVSEGKVTHVGIALTFGLVVMSMIYAVGDTSGAHLNPAVTLGFWIARRLPGASVMPYIGSQLLGAFAASGLLWIMFSGTTLGATHPAGPPWQSFVLETVLTAMLMFVILSVASGPKEKGLLAGVAIGGVIAFEALFAGPISGASMNPARSLAPAVLSIDMSDIWIYLAAPVLGAGIGVLGHKAIA
jgi:aquaporin NIP